MVELYLAKCLSVNAFLSCSLRDRRSWTRSVACMMAFGRFLLFYQGAARFTRGHCWFRRGRRRRPAVAAGSTLASTRGVGLYLRGRLACASLVQHPVGCGGSWSGCTQPRLAAIHLARLWCAQVYEPARRAAAPYGRVSALRPLGLGSGEASSWSRLARDRFRIVGAVSMRGTTGKLSTAGKSLFRSTLGPTSAGQQVVSPSKDEK